MDVLVVTSSQATTKLPMQMTSSLAAPLQMHGNQPALDEVSILV